MYAVGYIFLDPISWVGHMVHKKQSADFQKQSADFQKKVGRFSETIAGFSVNSSIGFSPTWQKNFT